MMFIIIDLDKYNQATYVSSWKALQPNNISERSISERDAIILKEMH